VDGVTLLLYRRHLQTLTYAAGRGEDGIALQNISYRLGEGQAGRAAMERQIVGLQRSDDGTWHTEPDYALYSRLSKPFPSTYAVPLIARGEVKGVLQMFHRDRLTTDPEWPSFLEALAAHAAIAIDNVQLLQDLQRSRDDLTIAYDATLEGWARALDLRDRETEGHSQRVTAMTVCLAHAMGISEAEIVHVRRGALLHDIGKIGIPDAILLKPGPLTDEERAVMCQHPYYAYTMLAPIAYLRPALDIPYCHHEKWDGSGYPRGLKGEEIPLAARIFAVVDVWDALRSDRPYRNAWPEEKVVSYIEDQAGHHFDPQVVDVFLRLYRENKHQNGCQEITKYSTRRYA
jgi:HD-GYP domain-containing protein (c-di-GMP phosphodiesterase class II)